MHRSPNVPKEPYYELLETLPLIVYSVEPSPPYAPLYVNRGIEIFGYSREEWLEDPENWVKSIFPADREAVLRESMRAMQTARPFEKEYRMLGRDGTVHWIHDRGSFVYAEGKPREWRGVMVDITARKNAELALAESEERYRKVVEAIPDVVVIHVDGRIRYVNPAAVRYFGASSAGELMEVRLLDLVHPDWRERVTLRVREVLATGAPSPLLELPLIGLDGRQLEVEATGARITFEGKPAIQVSARDIGPRRVAEERLRSAQRMEMIGRLAGGVAHDFNNILTVIGAHSNFLGEQLSGRPELMEEVTVIQSSVERAATLVRQLLAFGRQQLMTPVALEVNAVVRAAAVLMRRVVPENIEIDVRTDEAPLRILADRDMLDQVITNLMVNARDAMRHGGRLVLAVEQLRKETGVDAIGETTSSGNYACITVGDNGEGMSAATLARAFEPFFTTKPTGHGTGLGLSTVLGIVKQSGGFVTVESTPGRGTAVQLFFPFLSDRYEDNHPGQK